MLTKAELVDRLGKAGAAYQRARLEEVEARFELEEGLGSHERCERASRTCVDYFNRTENILSDLRQHIRGNVARMEAAGEPETLEMITRYTDEENDTPTPMLFGGMPAWAEPLYNESLNGLWEEDGSTQTSTHVCWRQLDQVDADRWLELEAGKFVAFERWDSGRIECSLLDSPPDLTPEPELDPEDPDY